MMAPCLQLPSSAPSQPCSPSRSRPARSEVARNHSGRVDQEPTGATFRHSSVRDGAALRAGKGRLLKREQALACRSLGESSVNQFLQGVLRLLTGLSRMFHPLSIVSVLPEVDHPPTGRLK